MGRFLFGKLIVTIDHDFGPARTPFLWVTGPLQIPQRVVVKQRPNESMRRFCTGKK